MHIERISPYIPAKSQREVNAISKYFKNNKHDVNSKQPPKSYAQASKQNISISEIIKIKEVYPPLVPKKSTKSTTLSKVLPSPNLISR